jgi:hypothetical protein
MVVTHCVNVCTAFQDSHAVTFAYTLDCRSEARKAGTNNQYLEAGLGVIAKQHRRAIVGEDAVGAGTRGAIAGVRTRAHA